MNKISLALITLAIVGISACSPATDSKTGGKGGASNSQSQAATGAFVEGKDYKVLASPVSADAMSQKVVVREYFWYACSHCFFLEEPMKTYLSKDGSSVRFERTAVALGPNWLPMSRAYYTMIQVGGFDAKLHDAFFAAWHVEKKDINQLSETLKVVSTVKGQEYANKFEKAYDSQEVKDIVGVQLKNAMALDINSTPTVIVGGKYVVDGQMAQSPTRMTQIIDYLAKEKMKK